MIPRKFYILCLLLIVAVVVNTIVHFSSPAYRYYKDVARRQDDNIALFKRQVTSEILPTFISSISNVVNISSSKSTISNVLLSAGAGASSPAPADSLVLPKLPSVISSAHVSLVGSDYYLSLDGHHYRVGDLFAGHRILQIFPNTLITDQQIICIGSCFERMLKDDK